MPVRLLASVFGALALAPSAAASELIARNTSDVRLAVNARGQALLTYRAAGNARRVLAWSAVDALPPTTDRPQVRFQLDYSGGWGTYRRAVWRGFPDVCGPYTGQPIGWLETACTAPDGSHWAVQRWRRLLRNYGEPATLTGSPWELRLSHWRSELPALDIRLDWAYRRFDHLYGRLTYLGAPVHGFRSTSRGKPLDSYGRNVYIDTYNSAYGPGWQRENGFLTHVGTGQFCYGFYPHGSRPSGRGTRYRATVVGPGVLPDIVWEGEAPGSYDRGVDLLANEEQRSMFLGSLCRPN